LVTYHGWVLAYDAQTLHSKGCLERNSQWRVRRILASGRRYGRRFAEPAHIASGNGPSTKTRRQNYGDSIIKLGFNTASWSPKTIPPHDQQFLADADVDLGSGGVLLIRISRGRNLCSCK
jgi:hypothetical protein